MLTYRVNFTGLSTQTTGQTTNLSAEGDSEALSKVAVMITPEAGAEVWQGSRMVCRLPPKSEGIGLKPNKLW